MTRRFFLSSVAAGSGAAGVSIPAYGQISPPKTASAIIGGKTITVDYYSPSMRGRKVFGGLVPYDSVWCPGANWATYITSRDAGLEIGTLKLPRGSYAIWVLPTEKQWTAILNSDSKSHHLDHRSEKDLGRISMKVKPLNEPVESLKFEVRGRGGNSGEVALLWEKTEASFPFSLMP